MRAFTIKPTFFSETSGQDEATIARRLINFSVGRPAPNNWIGLIEKVARTKSSKESHVAR